MTQDGACAQGGNLVGPVPRGHPGRRRRNMSFRPMSNPWSENMRTNKRLRPVRPRLEELETRLAPATLESFDTTAAGTLPAGWSQWGSIGTDAFAVAPSQALS